MGEAEIPCPDCEGTGTVPTRAGAVLLGFLVRHWRSGRAVSGGDG
jgi:hypothetical protein